jgi:hypothetical protein
MESHAESIVVGASPREWLLDPMPSPDQQRLGYIRALRQQHQSNLWQVLERDLSSSGERVLLEHRMGERSYIHGAGWLDEDSMILLPWTREADGTSRVTILELDLSGHSQVIDVAEQAFTETALLDAKAKTLYLTRASGRIHNLFAFSLLERRWQQLTENKIMGSTFSGIQISPDGNLLYARQVQSTDLWIVHLDQAN